LGGNRTNKNEDYLFPCVVLLYANLRLRKIMSGPNLAEPKQNGYYNNHRYHEAIDNVTPSDRFYGKDKEILEQRQRTKIETMNQRRKIYRLFLINDLMGGLN